MLTKSLGPCEKVSVKAVTKALNLMKTGKAAGPSDVTSEVLIVCKDESVKKLAQVADDLLLRKRDD